MTLRVTCWPDGLGDTFTWDAESRLVSAGGAPYTCDPIGQRVEKAGVGVTDTIYFGGQPIVWSCMVFCP